MASSPGVTLSSLEWSVDVAGVAGLAARNEVVAYRLAGRGGLVAGDALELRTGLVGDVEAVVEAEGGVLRGEHGRAGAGVGVEAAGGEQGAGGRAGRSGAGRGRRCSAGSGPGSRLGSGSGSRSGSGSGSGSRSRWVRLRGRFGRLAERERGREEDRQQQERERRAGSACGRRDHFVTATVNQIIARKRRPTSRLMSCSNSNIVCERGAKR